MASTPRARFLPGLPLLVSVPSDLLGGMVTDRLSSALRAAHRPMPLGAVAYWCPASALIAAGRASSTPMVAAVLIAVATGPTMFTLGAAWST